MVEVNEGTTQLKEGFVVFAFVLPPHRQPSKAIQPAKQPLYQVSLFVENRPWCSSTNSLLLVSLGNYGAISTFSESFPDNFRVVSSVSRNTATGGQVWYNSVNRFAVVAAAWANRTDLERQSALVDQHGYFAGLVFSRF